MNKYEKNNKGRKEENVSILSFFPNVSSNVQMP